MSKEMTMSVKQFCQASSLGRTTTYKLLNAGTLPSKKVRGRRVIDYDGAAALLRSNEG